ncbi:MAG: proline--tRNA ligase [Malacoplasma sp.]|nr:proline--tRNA ligase [Malacoplasma sp.]MDE6894145.1 proline--tRNA ligase [Malacoplasma sp.]
MSKIIKQEENFSKWYTSIIENADLIDYGLVKGTIVFKPYGWAIWKRIQEEFNKVLVRMNTQECCFPLFIPYSEFQKEKNHVEGFNPELFKISHFGNRKIEDELVVRPTSEISFCHYFKKNVNSYNDLPCILNQWANVFRVEKNTRPFLRTSEFFWQEQHAVFETKKDAYNFAINMANEYKEFVKDYLSIDSLLGEKTENEKFAGAENTFTIETLMPDGQVLQSATSHYLGQNFAKSFDIKYQTKNNDYQYLYQTSAGLSTRIIGAIIMSHSDNNGLVLPFKIAPIQFAIVCSNDVEDKNYLKNIYKNLFGYKYETFFVEKSLGLKLQENEIKGIPFQIIIGKKEHESGSITIYKRDTKTKESIKASEFNRTYIEKIVNEYSNNLFSKTKNRLENSIVFVENLEDFKNALEKGKIISAYWAGSKEDEKKLKELTTATPRCFDINQKEDISKKCFFTNNKNPKLVYFARAY